MYCPFCNSKQIRVLDSRHVDEENAIKRRRECEECKKRFTTVEVVKETGIIVIKKDGRRDIFDKDKIFRGLLRSCQKRKITPEEMKNIADNVERDIINSMKKEIKSQEIGEMVLSRLRKLDPVSYIRFASVYREFEDIKSFFDELDRLKNDKKNDK